MKRFEDYGVALVVMAVLGMTSIAFAGDAMLPAGVKAVWEMEKAWKQATPTQERICINGLWRWQPCFVPEKTGTTQGADAPADIAGAAVPGDNWGFVKVPGPMIPGSSRVVTYYPHPSWQAKDMKTVKLGWYQREITIPANWAGRRIVVATAYLNKTATMFVDGKKGGVIDGRWGEADITGLCQPGKKQLLSIFVETNGFGRTGLVGDVYLESMPMAERIDDVKVDTSVRKGEIALDSALTLKPGKTYILKAQALEGGKAAKEIASSPFTAADLKGGRFTFANPWKCEKLWDLNTPGNQYDLKVTLADDKGNVIDEFPPVRFGFRELWIEGRELRLNGTRICCFEIPLDNGNGDLNSACYDGAMETFRRMQAIGVNMMYTHNYGCALGSHASFEEIMRAADDCGMLLSMSQPHYSAYKWEGGEAEAKNGYAEDAEFYVRQAQNHPSVVFYSTSHNATGYSDDQNPDRIDGIYTPWPDPDGKLMRVDRYGRLATKAQEIIERFDATRPVYHHQSGNLGKFYTLNCYLDFAPIQERSDWFEHWSKAGVKPLMLVEYGVPLDENWANWREGHDLFSNPKLLNQYFWAEWGAQWRGDAAYQISDQEKANIRYEAKHWRDKETFHKSWMPFFDTRLTFANVREVQAMYIHDNWPAFRTLGVTGMNAWAESSFFKGLRNARIDTVPVVTDWDRLQRPGYAPETARRAVSTDETAKSIDWRPVGDAAGEALVKYSRPVLAYIAGRPGAVTSKDHNYLPGDKVQKQIIVINNSRTTVKADCDVDWPNERTGLQPVEIATGGQARMPVEHTFNEKALPGRYELHMTANLGEAGAQSDTFAIDILPRPVKLAVKGKVAVYDPARETTKLLKDLGVQFTPIIPTDKLDGFDVLIIGKRALTLTDPKIDLARVRDGLKVIVFEQTTEVLTLRLGFRAEEYVLRQTFPRIADHPALEGITAGNLADWRGEGTSVPHSLTVPMVDPNEYPLIEWYGLSQPRAWRAGCRGSVASVLIEKPAVGDFLPIIDGGFNLQYSPLMEYREGKGLVVFCQLDVTGRTEADPAATRIVSNLLNYVSTWKPAPRMKLRYMGGDKGKKHLEAMGLDPVEYKGGALGKDEVLVVAEGRGKMLPEVQQGIAKWADGGGTVIGIGLEMMPELSDAGLGTKTLVSFGKFTAEIDRKEYFSGEVPLQKMASPFAGISPAEVYDRDAREIALVTGGAETLAGGALAKSAKGNVILCQLAPWDFDYARNLNLKPTFQRTSFLVSRILANAGVAGDAPLLKWFAEPLPERAKRPDVPGVVWMELEDKELVLPRVWKGLPLGTVEPPKDWETPAFDDAKWRAMKVPGFWEDQYDDLVNLDGLFLYRVAFDVPEDWTGKDVRLVLGAVDDEDWTYVNGQLVGSLTRDKDPKYWAAVRSYRIPAGVIKTGRNVIAVKVNDIKGSGGLKASTMKRHGAGSVRWLSGMYLDKPEFLDDVYRYYRW